MAWGRFIAAPITSRDTGGGELTDTFPPHTPLLHVYAQGQGHDYVRIAGNRLGLIALKEAVDNAVFNFSNESSVVFDSSGEGYSVLVLRLTEAEMVKTHLPYPVCDEMDPAPDWLVKRFRELLKKPR